MHEFETFVYLDVQKTGSTFICKFLRKFSNEKEIRKELHAGMPEDYDQSKFYFISVRDPLDQYISLYSFGCQTDGKLYQTLEKKGFGDFYDGTWSGFRTWLRFVLDPENAQLLGGGYGQAKFGHIGDYIGYQSYRVLTLAIPNADNLLADCHSKGAISDAHKRNNIVGYTVRNETLRSDLTDLFSTKLSSKVSNLAQAMSFIEAEEAHNTSDRIDRYESNPTLGKNLRRLLEEREWLMYEEFGY